MRNTRRAAARWLFALLLAFSSTHAYADASGLAVSIHPQLPVELGSQGRLFRAEQGSQISLRAARTVEGAALDVTSSCTFTPLSSAVAVSPDGTVTFALTAQETIAVVVVECAGARKGVGFLVGETEP